MAVTGLALGAIAGVSPAGATGGFPDYGTVVGIGLFRPEALSGAPDGARYVADTFNNRAVRLVPGSTAPVVVAGGPGSGIGQYPGGVAVDSQGRVYVSDSFNERVLRFPAGAPAGTAGVVVAGGPGTGPGNGGSALDRLRSPSKITFDEDDRLYVVDTGNARVLRFDQGTATGEVVAAGLSFPVGLALDEQARIYVTDIGDHRILRFTPPSTVGVRVAGGPFTTSANRGSTLDRLDGPAGVGVDSQGNVYVADTQNHRVVRWAPGAASGELVAGGTRGAALNQLNLPADVLVEGDDAFATADRENGRILRFSDRLQVLVEPEAEGLMAALAAASGAFDVVTSTPTTFECGTGTQPRPRPGRSYLDVLAGVSYLAVDGSTATLPTGCTVSLVTTTTRE
jgi:sugar lactone lactonase YvrE